MIIANLTMKNSLIIFLFVTLAAQLNSQSASGVYPLSSTTAGAVSITGNLTGRAESFSGMVINNYSGPSSSQRATTLTGAWDAETGQNDARYIQFAVSPAAGYNFTVNTISMNLGAAGGGNMRANIRYSTDSTFTESVLLNPSPLVLPSGAFISPAPNYSPGMTVYDGETIFVRIYPWYTSSSTGKYVCPQNVTIQGTTVAASVVKVSLTSLPDFGAIVAGSSSAAQMYTVSGSSLSGDVKIYAPSSVKVSNDNVNYFDSLSLVQSGGVLAPATIYSKFQPGTADGSYSGAIVHTSVNAGAKYVDVMGTAVAAEPTTQSTVSFGTVTGSSIAVNFSGGNGARRVLVAKRDAAVNWQPVDGTILLGVNSNFLNAQNQGNENRAVYDGTGNSVTVTGLLSNVTYHFAVYEYNQGENNSQNYLTVSPGTGSQTTLAVPTIITNPASLAFGNVGAGIPSADKSYTITAATLSPSSGNITVTAPAGYQVSMTSGTGYTSSLQVPYTNGGVSGVTIYVKFTPAALTSYEGNITHTGGSAPQENVAVTGAGMVPNAQQNVDIIVAQDGTGDFTTIQAAINSIPNNNTTLKVILIKKGTYNEKIYISNSNITLVGEDRAETKIIYAELRSIWHGTSGGSDWGAATLNINSNVTNLTLANLTVYNNYGTLFGSTDHQFAVRGATTDRISFINCDIKADGGDTIALWNASSGKSYHYNCYFEGYVDFVCPRGWAYISDSRFYQRSASASASIWHDGSPNQNGKLVIRNSRFDGVPNFALGRHHLDAQFYLIDNTFSTAMRNQPIFFATSNPPVTLQWGQRYYYHNNKRDSVDFAWYANNLDSAAGSPTPNQVTAEWTFSTAPSTWNPEAAFPKVVPNAEFPSPARNKTAVSKNALLLSWVAGRRAVSHNIYFGTSEQPVFAGNVSVNSFNPGVLQDTTRYYWRVDAVSAYDTVAGEVWTFTTGIDSVVPVELVSFTAATNGNTVMLEWKTSTEKNNSGFEIERKSGSGNWVKRGFVPGRGTTTEAGIYTFTDQTEGTESGTLYYRLKQIDYDGTFTYLQEVKTDISKPGSFNLHQNYPNPFNPITRIKFEIPEMAAGSVHVTLKVYDALGREVDIPVNEVMTSGYYDINFSAGTLASGIYYYQLKAGSYMQTRKMTILK